MSRSNLWYPAPKRQVQRFGGAAAAAMGVAAAAVLFLPACGGDASPGPQAVVDGVCEIGASSAPDAGSTAAGDAGGPDELRRIGCRADFEALASLPLDITLPGARSAKVVLDRHDGDALHFQNSQRYAIHYDFVSTHLSGGAFAIVPPLGEFNVTEYFSPERRFVLGAVTHYEQPGIWALELSPYDTASAEMIATLYRAVKSAAFFGPALVFHPTSEAIAAEAKKLPADVAIVTTEEIYARIDYQPLTLATGVGRLRFARAADLANIYLSYQEIVVLDEAPNDISVVQGLITEVFQTPLSHVNVLSQNRHTPNMGLRNALSHPDLVSREGQLVELTVGASSWSIRDVTAEEAQAFWDAHKPTPIVLPAMNLQVTELVDLENVTPEPPAGASLRDAIKNAVLAFGGKSAHYSILARTENVPVLKGFAVPVFYYDQFMRENGLYDQVDALLADPQFMSDPAVRAQALLGLQAAILAAPINAEFQALLQAKLQADYPGQVMRFRTSTNSEDLDGFPCAGCYESHTGDPAIWTDVLDAIRQDFASMWQFRTFEERSYYGIDHKSVAMALLVHHNFPAEEANGVAVTANPFDPSGLDPAFYVNVQAGGDAEVVAPPPGVTSDQFLYYFGQQNQPIVFISHSNLVLPERTVLTPAQCWQLGTALDAIHRRFSPAYGSGAGNTGWYAMDVEFKFDNDAAPEQPATLYVKQARPYPGRGR